MNEVDEKTIYDFSNDESSNGKLDCKLQLKNDNENTNLTSIVYLFNNLNNYYLII